MPGGINLSLFDNALQFESQQWNVARVFAVSDRRKQPNEALFANGVAVTVIYFDADIIQVAMAMDCRTGIGFGDYQPVFGACMATHFLAEFDRPATAFIAG